MKLWHGKSSCLTERLRHQVIIFSITTPVKYFASFLLFLRGALTRKGVTILLQKMEKWKLTPPPSYQAWESTHLKINHKYVTCKFNLTYESIINIKKLNYQKKCFDSSSHVLIYEKVIWLRFHQPKNIKLQHFTTTTNVTTVTTTTSAVAAASTTTTTTTTTTTIIATSVNNNKCCSYLWQQFYN